MKGISPMIAVVLLIAFTVALGGVLSVWLTGLTTTQTQQVTNQSSSQVKCSPSLQIDRVDNTSGSVNVTFSNPSQLTISGIVASVILPNASIYSTSAGSLTSGSANWTNTGTYVVVPTMVRVSGTCSGLPVTATCKSSEICWRGL
jgi:flagellin-like protein